VVLSRGAQPDERGLRKFLSDHVPAFMVPREFRFVDALPRNPSGKVEREQVVAALRRMPPIIRRRQEEDFR
jgi:acyl-coenzyme A synthetase/AMP-(fatty) acid ligase